MFYKKGTCKFFLYSTRQLPKSWLTSNGTFTTYGKGSIQVNFFEYSKSKEVTVTPYIIQYGKDTENKPAFDLILGTKTLNELGIILDFKNKIITIDEIKLPMQSIEELPTSRKRAWQLNNAVARNIEPASTHDPTQRAVRILDAKYEKADLQSVVKDNCKHLPKNDQQQLLELLLKFEELFDGTLGDWKTTPVSFEL